METADVLSLVYGKVCIAIYVVVHIQRYVLVSSLKFDDKKKPLCGLRSSPISFCRMLVMKVNLENNIAE